MVHREKTQILRLMNCHIMEEDIPSQKVTWILSFFKSFAWTCFPQEAFPHRIHVWIIYLHERWKMDKTGHMNNGKWLGKYSRPTWILSFARRSEEFTCNSTASGDGNSIGSNATSTMLLWILGKFIGKKNKSIASMYGISTYICH